MWLSPSHKINAKKMRDATGQVFRVAALIYDTVNETILHGKIFFNMGKFIFFTGEEIVRK
jgi:hypothetical protein